MDDNLPGELMRDKVGIYAEAGYPAYKDENGDGYPDDVNVSKRLAVFIGNYPDHYETYRPKMDGPFVPSVKDEKGHYIRRETFSGTCARSFYVGDTVKKEDIHAKFEDGILHIQLPAPQQQKALPENPNLIEIE